MLVLLPLVGSLLLAASTALTRATVLRRFSAIATSAVVLAVGLALSVAALHGSPVMAGGLLRVDALSAFMLSVVGAVGLTATWGGLAARDVAPPDWTYSALICLFLGAMSLAVLADNLGVLWVAVEATTIATAFLVGHNRTRRSLEAAWKYVVLGSVGVAVAFLGLVLLYAASVAAGHPTLSWVALTDSHLALDPSIVKVAGALAVLGFATKAGLAPMHSWLPDAHSQAPAPVSGLMSGVLLSVAFYAILRIQAVVNLVLGTGLMRGLLVATGLLSLAVAAGLVVRQRDLKRMLAYSSIEHMGLLALAAAVGGTVAIAAALLHVLGHGLAKSSLFVVSGRISVSEGTTQLAHIRGLLGRHPAEAVPYLVGMAAMLGLPPFSLFFTEVAIMLAGFQRGLGWAMTVAAALMLVLFAGLARLSLGMTFGAELSEPLATTPAARQGPQTPLALALGVTAVLGFAAGPLPTLLTRAAVLLTGAK